MKKYLTVILMATLFLLVNPNDVLAIDSVNTEEKEQIVSAAPTMTNDRGFQNVQKHSFFTIYNVGSYADKITTVDGFEVYKKTSKGYELVISVNNESYDVEVITDVGEKVTYVARAYVYDSNNKKVYSPYSNKIVVDNTIKTPVLTNGMGYKEVDQYSFLTIIGEGAYAESTYHISGYDVYLKTSKGYTLVGTNEDFSEISVVTKLGKKEEYVARAYAYNLNNKKVYSKYSEVLVIDNTIPAPTFSIKNSYYTSLKLEWTHNAPIATGYKIYRATSKNGKYSYVATVKANETDLGSKLSYTDTKKTFNKTYYYKIRAYYEDENGKTTYSGYSSIKSKKVVTPAPTLEGNTSGFLKNKLTWNKVSGASGYAIYKLENGKYVYQTSTKSLSYSDTLKNSKTKLEFSNSYKIRAYRTVNGKKVYGPYSNVITLESKLSTPKLTYTSIDHTSYKITSNSISGATSYQLFICNDVNCEEIPETMLSNEKIDEVITVNSMAEKQYYAIQAIRTINGESIYSELSPVYTFSALPKIVDITDEESYFSEVTAKSGIEFNILNTLPNVSFEIYRSTSKDGEYLTTDSIQCMTALEFYIFLLESFGMTLTEEQIEELKVELGDMQYIYICGDSGVEVGKTYYYKIRTVMEENGVKYYSEFSDIDTIKIKPVKVENLTLTPKSYNSTLVEWDLSNDADGYEIYRATSKTGKYTKIKTVETGVTSYENTKLTLNKRYYYKVRAYYLDAEGKKVYGSYSDVKSRYVKALTQLNSNDVVIVAENGSKIYVKSTSSTLKKSSGSNNTYSFKINFTKTTAPVKTNVYYNVRFYDAEGTLLTIRTFTVNLPKGTKKNYSKSYTVTLPKNAVYYEFE